MVCNSMFKSLKVQCNSGEQLYGPLGTLVSFGCLKANFLLINLGSLIKRHTASQTCLRCRVPTSSGNYGKPGKSQKSCMHGKIIE